MHSTVCICLASTSPQWVTGHSGVWRCSVSTRHSAQVETCPSQINFLTWMHTQINDSVLPVSGRKGWLTHVSFSYPYIMSYFYCCWNPQISVHPSTSLPRFMIFWQVLDCPPIACNHLYRRRFCLRGDFCALWGIYGLWWVMGLLLGSFHWPGPPAEPSGAPALLGTSGETWLTGSANIAALREKALLPKTLFIVLFTKSYQSWNIVHESIWFLN